MRTMDRHSTRGRTFPDDLRGKKIVVLGAGRSGRAAAGLLARHGAHVILADDDPRSVRSDQLDHVVASHVELVLGNVAAELAEKAAGVVTSPGVPLDHPLLVRARQADVPIIGEFELGARHAGAPILAVTGTNGKTTTVRWIAHFLAKAGKKAIVCGNIGIALCDVAHQACDWLVAEVSSFQLQTIERFRPRVAAILNLSEDHLDRHPTTGEYLATKARIAENQQAEDALVLNRDDRFVWSLSGKVRSSVWGFSLERPVEQGAFVEHGKIVLRTEPGRPALSLARADGLSPPGMHNLANALAASVAAWLCGVGEDHLAEGLRDFPGVEHRLETVRVLRDVLYVNDSKATNLGSLEVALRSFDRPIVLIAGGRGKGAPYGRLRQLISDRVRHLIVFGEEAEHMAAAWGDCVATSRVADMEEAVDKAASLARAGDVVLLSPACASFDMYRNFEERGRHFKNLVMRLE